MHCQAARVKRHAPDGTMTAKDNGGTNQHVATVAERFKTLRDALGLTQGGFSGVSRTEINKIENGANQLTGGTLRARVARAIGVSTDDLAAYIEGQLLLPALLSRRGGAPVPAAAQKWVKVDAATKRKAIVYLKQPPQAFSDQAIEQAFDELRIADPDVARSPRQVADAVRVVILGVLASLPGVPSAPKPSSTHRSR
jgi:transcriptional regulator with XRE-family HTH domain